MANTEPSDHVYRLARPEDHRQIMNISGDVYNGLDYLDWAFPLYVKYPTIRCFVLEQDGEVVSL